MSIYRGLLLGITAISAAAGAYSYFRKRPNSLRKERNYLASHLVGLSVFISLLTANAAYKTQDSSEIIPLLVTSLAAGESAIVCDSEYVMG